MTLTYYERGKLQGERNALRRMALLQLETKFGALTATAKARLEGMSIEDLEKFVRDLIPAQSLKALGFEAEE